MMSDDQKKQEDEAGNVINLMERKHRSQVSGPKPTPAEEPKRISSEQQKRNMQRHIRDRNKSIVFYQRPRKKPDGDKKQ